MLIGMLLETLGVGLVIPVIAFLASSDPVASYPVLRPLFEYLDNPEQKVIVVCGLIFLVLVYIGKNSFLAFLVWRQN